MRAVIYAIFTGVLGVTGAAALDMPTRKPGLWQLTMNFDNRSMPARTMKQCIDAETDKLMSSPTGAMGREQCAKNDVQRLGNTIVVDSVCNVANATSVTHSVITGDFNSNYTVEVDSKREGGASTKMMLAAKWLGPCAAGQRPGDMIMEGGMTINLRDMQQMRGMPGTQGPPGGQPRR
jgi:hypothetical protein